MRYNVTPAALAAILEASSGMRPATMRSLTDARLLKTGNPHGQVNKLSHVNVNVGAIYENGVNNQREREGSIADFVAQPPKWGVRVGKKLVTHNGNWYLPVAIRKPISKPRYLRDKDNAELEETDIRTWKPAEKSNADHQGLEKELVWRTYKIDSIMEMTLDGNTYVVGETISPELLVPEIPAVHLEIEPEMQPA